MIDIERVGRTCLKAIKTAPWFPYKSGNLKFNATRGEKLDDNTFVITFDSTIANYIQYLEEGTQPHDIPFAFVGKGNWKWWYPYKDGVPFLFGMGGRFDGKFHPGSTKHKGFISEKSVDLCTKIVSEGVEIEYVSIE